MTDFLYICENCGAEYPEIPEVYRGFSGDHFGGSRTVWPGCHSCDHGTFKTVSKREWEELKRLRANKENKWKSVL